MTVFRLLLFVLIITAGAFQHGKLRLHKINHLSKSHHGVRVFEPLEQNIQLTAATTALLQSPVPNDLGVVMTFQELFDAFSLRHCNLAFHGGAACSLINNNAPRDFDLDYGCTKAEVVVVLRAVFTTATVAEPDTPQTLVPHNIDKDLEFSATSWFSTQRPENQEYTANMLRLDPLARSISGYTQVDLQDCRAKVINLPVPLGAVNTNELIDIWATQHLPLLARPTARVFKLFGKGFAWKTDAVKDAWHGAISRSALAHPEEFAGSFCEAVSFYLCLYISEFQAPLDEGRWDKQTKKCQMTGINFGQNYANLAQQPKDMRTAIIAEIPDYRNTIRTHFLNAADFP